MNDADDDDLQRGLANRRDMLGDEWVERSLIEANAFNAEFRHLITRFAWHEIWAGHALMRGRAASSCGLQPRS
jgi:hypothetical protein